jgi:hypothetical protein
MARSSSSSSNADNAAYYAKSREIPRGSHSSHDSNISRHTSKSHNTTAAAAQSSSSAVGGGKRRVDGNYSNRWNWNQTGAETDEDGLTQDELDQLIPALAWRSYHLPGNSTNMADWCQYMANNHPVFGICCHHRLHPIRWPVRILHLLGSFIFGLLVTNMIWLWFLHSQEHDENNVIMTVSVNGERIMGNNVTTNNHNNNNYNNNNNNNNTDNNNIVPLDNLEDLVSTTPQQMQITEGMALLWTVGSGCHALFDNIIWYLTACICCLPGQSLENLARYKKYGIGLVIFTVLCIASVATFVVVLRAALQDEDDAAQDLQDLEQEAGFYGDDAASGSGGGGGVNGTIPMVVDVESSDFQFLVSYSVELCLALFVYYPIVMSILFSGIFGCGRIPVLGGRPYELRLEQVRLCEAAAEEQQQQQQLAAERRALEKQQQQRVRQSRRSGGRRPGVE